MLAVRREGAHFTLRKRDFVRESTSKRHGEQALGTRVAHAPGAEEDGRTVGRPAHDVVRAGVEGQTPGHAAASGHHVHVGIAVVRAAVSDPLAVGRNERVRLGPGAGGQGMRRAAIARTRPEIVAIGENDFRGADRRPVEQCRGSGLRKSEEREKDAQQQRANECLHERPPRESRGLYGGRRGLSSARGTFPTKGTEEHRGR